MALCSTLFVLFVCKLVAVVAEISSDCCVLCGGVEVKVSSLQSAHLDSFPWSSHSKDCKTVVADHLLLCPGVGVMQRMKNNPRPIN